MKAIESFSVSESFGLKDLNLDEIENINGGATASIGSCTNIGSVIIDGLNGPILTGAVGPTNPPISGGQPSGPVVISGPSGGSGGSSVK